MTLEQLIAIFDQMPSHIEAAEHAALEQSGRVIEAEAKALIGTEYPGWPALADDTIAEKEKLGFTGHISATDPLLRTGEMRESIQHSVDGHHSVTVGSDLDKAMWQEHGTPTIPPRPFLAAAGVQEGDKCAHLIADAVTRALSGQPTVEW